MINIYIYGTSIIKHHQTTIPETPCFAFRQVRAKSWRSVPAAPRASLPPQRLDSSWRQTWTPRHRRLGRWWFVWENHGFWWGNQGKSWEWRRAKGHHGWIIIWDHYLRSLGNIKGYVCHKWCKNLMWFYAMFARDHGFSFDKGWVSTPNSGSKRQFSVVLWGFDLQSWPQMDHVWSLHSQGCVASLPSGHRRNASRLEHWHPCPWDENSRHAFRKMQKKSEGSILDCKFLARPHGYSRSLSSQHWMVCTWPSLWSHQWHQVFWTPGTHWPATSAPMLGVGHSHPRLFAHAIWASGHAKSWSECQLPKT